MNADWCVNLKKKLLVIWLIFNGKQNNGNLDVLKQDSYFSLCLETIFVFSDCIMWFSLPYFRYELLSLKVEW